MGRKRTLRSKNTYARWIGSILSKNNLNREECIETLSKLLKSINVVAKVIEENRRYLIKGEDHGR